MLSIRLECNRRWIVDDLSMFQKERSPTMSLGSSSPRTPLQSKERSESSSSGYLSSDGGSEWTSRASLAWEEKSGSRTMRSSSINSGDSDYFSQAATLDSESKCFPINKVDYLFCMCRSFSPRPRVYQAVKHGGEFGSVQG